MLRFLIPILFACTIFFSTPAQAAVVQVTFSGTIDSVPLELATNPFFEVGSHVSWTITVDNEPLNIGDSIAQYSGNYSSHFSLGTFSFGTSSSSAAAYLDVLDGNLLQSGVSGFALEFANELFLTMAGVSLRDSTQTAFGASLEDTPFTDLLNLDAFDSSVLILGFTSLPAPPDTEIQILVDITEITVTAVPVPAAAWFFFSSLISLIWLRKSN